MSKEKMNKGITLIALIITIIVMMILVAVSVTVALNGGLFGTAKDAASKTQIEAEKEMLLSAVVGAIGTDARVDFSKVQLPDGFTGENGVYESSNGNRFAVSENGEINQVTFIYKDNIEGLGTGVTLVPYVELTGELKAAADLGKISAVIKETKDGVEMQAVIPAGFDVSIKNGENTISGGLVVSDANENEFVWVPCTTDVNGTSGLIIYKQDTQYNTGALKEIQGTYTNYTGWTDDGGNSKSVSKYKGFYVGRYEAGIPSNAPFYANVDGEKYLIKEKNTTDYIPVSKPKQPTWNWISQSNAKIVSEKMYSDSVSVQSSLIDSYAWDTIVNWMESENSGIAIDSTNFGNYLNSTISLNDIIYAVHKYSFTKWTVVSYSTKYQKGKLEVIDRITTGEQPVYELETGAMDNSKVLNIYDMAGNMWEWTTEVRDDGNKICAVRRGGSFAVTSTGYPVSGRSGNTDVLYPWISESFRVVLYIK